MSRSPAGSRRSPRRLVVGVLATLLAGLAAVPPAAAHLPHHVIESIDLSPDYADDRTLFIIVSSALRLQKSTDGGLSWERPARGLDYRHRPTAVRVSPSFAVDGTVYLATDGDGIYRSTDGGRSWKTINDGLAELRIASVHIALDHFASGHVLAAGVDGGLHLRTGDESWRQVLDDTVRVAAVAHPADPHSRLILAGSDRGKLLRSIDRGESWQELLEIPEARPIRALAITADGTVFCGTLGGGIYRSIDGGRTFEPANTGLDDAEVTALAASPRYGEDRTVVATTWHDGVYRSTDGGLSWVQTSDGLSKNYQADSAKFRSPHFRDLRMSRGFATDDTLFVAGYDGLFRSTDGGRSWLQLESMPGRRIEGIAISPGFAEDHTLYLATFNAGAYRSTDAGASWTVHNQGLLRDALVDIAVSPDYPRDGTVFTESNSEFYRSTHRGDRWQKLDLRPHDWRHTLDQLLRQVRLNRFWTPLSKEESYTFLPDRIVISPGFAVDRTLYFGSKYQGVFRSTDGGLNWSRKLPADWQLTRAVAISPGYVDDGTLFAAITDEAIYRTTDRGESWEKVYELPERPYRQTISLAISPAYPDDQTVFAGTSDSLLASTDGGLGWRPLEIAGLERAYVEHVGMAPSYTADHTVMLSVRGRGLYVSETAEPRFEKACVECLPEDAQLTFLRFSPGYGVDGTIWAASEFGLHRSSDRGRTWTTLPRPVRYESTKNPIAFLGSWELVEDDAHSTRDAHRTAGVGSRVTFDFVGTGVRCLGTRSPRHGLANVYLDDHYKGQVDLYAGEESYREEIYLVTGLEPGPHRIALEVAPERPPRSSGHRLEIDAFDVLP